MITPSGHARRLLPTPEGGGTHRREVTSWRVLAEVQPGESNPMSVAKRIVGMLLAGQAVPRGTLEAFTPPKIDRADDRAESRATGRIDDPGTIPESGRSRQGTLFGE
jgi:hypothetical protein